MISPKKNKNNQPKLTPKFESDHLYLKQSKKRFYMKLTKILKSLSATAITSEALVWRSKEFSGSFVQMNSLTKVSRLTSNPTSV